MHPAINQKCALKSPIKSNPAQIIINETRLTLPRRRRMIGERKKPGNMIARKNKDTKSPEKEFWLPCGSTRNEM